MRSRKVIYITISLLIILCAVLFFILLSTRKDSLSVIFFDVGQGDAILVSQGEYQMLIDGGKNGSVLLQHLGRHIPFWDNTIELVVQTHPDQDHIGGLVDIFDSYRVETFMKTKAESQSQTFKRLGEEIKSHGVDIVEVKSGEKVIFPKGAQAEILFPTGNSHLNEKETNASSIVLRLAYGDNSFLMTGDLPSEQEQELIENKINLQADILKVAHHGSKYSTSKEFIELANPKDAIISSGKDNTYGHPHQETLQKLLKEGARILRTDELGTIEYVCISPQEECDLQTFLQN